MLNNLALFDYKKNYYQNKLLTGIKLLLFQRKRKSSLGILGTEDMPDFEGYTEDRGLNEYLCEQV